MNIEEKLKSLKVRKSNITKLKSELSDHKKRLNEEKKVFKELEKKMDKEYKDFKKLETLSIASLFSSIKGNKEEKLEKEKQEYLEAKLNYEKSKDTLKLLRDRINFITNEIKSENQIEEEYQQALKEKEQYIISSDGKKSKQLLEIDDQITETEIVLKETNEAIEAGYELNTNLSKIIMTLESAKDWGTYDMFGGGTTSTHIKHSKINDARYLTVKTQYLVKNYTKELNDINFSADILKTLEISDFNTFADYFLDNFFSDFMVQNKINHSLDNVKSKKHKINKIQNELKNKRSQLTKKIEELESKKKEIVELN